MPNFFVRIIAQAAAAAQLTLLAPDASLTASSASSSTQAALSNLASFGASPSLLATGVYSWSDLNIIEDGSTLPALTNEQCNVYTQHMANQTAIQASIKAELAKVLPVTAAGISFPNGITCGPRFATQTRDDQAAVFSITGLTLKSIYTLFAKNAVYVTIASPSSVNVALQLSEALAPLSIKGVRAAVQNALRRSVLVNYQASISTFFLAHRPSRFINRFRTFSVVH